MFGNMNNSPPIVEYEQVVHPVGVTPRGAPLSRRDHRQPSEEKRRRRRAHEEPLDLEDKVFEPFIGKLFDYSA